MAADEKIGETDILSRNCQGTQRQRISLGDRYNVRFLFAYEIIPLPPEIVKDFRYEK
jgi:hypothetical protein